MSLIVHDLPLLSGHLGVYPVRRPSVECKARVVFEPPVREASWEYLLSHRVAVKPKKDYPTIDGAQLEAIKAFTRLPPLASTPYPHLRVRMVAQTRS